MLRATRASTLCLAGRRFVSSVPSSSSGEQVPRASAPPVPDVEIPYSQASKAIGTFTAQESYKRESFEIPADNGTGSGGPPRWRKFLPIFIGLGGMAWGYLAYQFVMDDTPLEYLTTKRFIPFVITNKLDVDDDHYLVELTPKFQKWKHTTKFEQIWNGNQLWSVEVKQPQIMVVRKYTPLPLELYDSEFTKQPVVRIQDANSRDGKLVLYIKKYSQGEVARWIYRQPLGSELELRGPYEEFKFPITKNNNVERPWVKNVPSETLADPHWPEQPRNVAFFCGGTGIAPALQMLLTRNPYRGFVDVYYSHKTDSEVPFPHLLSVLERIDRAKFHHEKLVKRVPNPAKDLELKPIDTTVEYKSALEQAQASKKLPKEPPSLALVCGPDGFVKHIAGAKPFESQGPLGGLLEQNGWKQEQVFKME